MANPFVPVVVNTLQPISNFTYTLNASNRTVNFTWTYLAKQAQFLSSDSGTISIRNSNGGSIYFRPFVVSLRTGSFSFSTPVPVGRWLYGELSFSVRGATNTLRTIDFGFDPFSVRVSNVTSTSAILQLSGDSLPSVSDTFNVYKVSDNSLVFTSPQTQLVSGRSVTATNLQSNTVYRAQFRRMVSPNFTTMANMPVCVGDPPTITANSGNVIKKTGQTIPGVAGKFDVYDATTFCPAFVPISTDIFRYQLPQTYKLYDVDPFNGNKEGPSFFSIMQGAIGNCALEAVMAAMAHKNPDVIKSGIVPDPTALHTFFVRFYYKKINAPFWVRLTATLPMNDAGRSYDDTLSSNDWTIFILWSQLLMKAYCCMQNIFPDFMRHEGVGYNTLWGIDPIDCAVAVFGEDINTFATYYAIDYECLSDASINRRKSELDTQNIKNLMNSRDVIIIAGIDWDIQSKLCSSYPLSNRYELENNYILKVFNPDRSIKHCFIGAHGYSVLEYRHSDNKVLIRNPWGGYNPCTVTNPSTWGVSAIDYDDFVRCFFFVLVKRTANPVMSNMQLLTPNYFP